jgi:hypothetical protein
MLIDQQCARLAASEQARRGTLMERRLRRFSPSAQPLVHAIAARHPRVADLAVTFPALLFALAVPRRDVDPERALAGAIEGRSLAQAAAVPLWLRRLPYDALTRPVPPLPDGEFMRRRIVNHLPRSPKLAPLWLEAVAAATMLGHELFAIWIARELTCDPKGIVLRRLRLISLWAWFSLHGDTLGHRLIERRWHPAMRFKTALDDAQDWRTQVALHADLGAEPIADMWLEPGSVDGYDFVPLDSAESIADEAAGMNNCLRTYGYDVAHNRCRFWGVRKGGQRIATLKVAWMYNGPLLTIRELRLAENRNAPVEVWWAAARWLHRQGLPRIETKRYDRGTAPLNAAAWRSVWRPYWLAKRRIPIWLPLKPSREALAAL